MNDVNIGDWGIKLLLYFIIVQKFSFIKFLCKSIIYLMSLRIGVEDGVLSSLPSKDKDLSFLAISQS